MNAKDLMIGDWVIPRILDAYDKPRKIVGIHYNSYRGKDYPDYVDCEVWDELDMKDIKPISLTPEILKKIGFELQDGWYRPFRKIGDDDIAIRLPKKGDMYQYTEFEYSKLCYNPEDVTESEFDCSMTIKGVANLHELQHFMRLCGIEREIIL